MQLPTAIHWPLGAHPQFNATMSTRRRHSAITATEVLEPQSPHDALPKLQFKEPLSWRAGKPIAIGDLIRRLNALWKELDKCQEDIDRDSLTKVSRELAGHGLLAHKDKGVRAWTACCLVEVLRVCAPHAPYTHTQLKDIFTLIITSIFPALSDPSNAYNSQHMHVLQSLGQCKSIVLLADIPSSDTLILQLFTCFFDVLSGSSKSSTGEQIGINVEHHLTVMLCILVDEAPHLPAEIVDIMLAQFLRVDPRVMTGGATKTKRSGPAAAMDERQATLLMKELPPAYNMAKTVCNSYPEKMARYVSQYFNDIIVDASSSMVDMPTRIHQHRNAGAARDASDDEDAHLGPTGEDLHDLQKAHRLLRELWRASPAVLQNVLPQLEAELSAENIHLRLLGTETLGDMIAGIGAAGPPPPPVMDPTVYPPPTLDERSEPPAGLSVLTTPASPQPFTQTHPAAYNSFRNRSHDRSPLIRAAWTTAVGRILSTSAGGMGLSQKEERLLLEDLAAMLGDTHERVRVAAVKSIGQFEFHDIVFKLGSLGGTDKQGSILYNLADRARDTRPAVRVEALMTLGRIWGVAAGEIASGNETVTSILGSIPSKLFDTRYVNDRDLDILLDQVTFELLLPLDYPPTKSKAANGASRSQNADHSSQGQGGTASIGVDWDRIRTERVLQLVKGLDEKAKKAFFAMQGRQVRLASVAQPFLQMCKDYNGGLMEKDEIEITSRLTRAINYLKAFLPDASKASTDLWKFAKLNNGRNYHLIGVCINPARDYRQVVKAIKELRNRIQSRPGSPAAILETLNPLLYGVSLLIYNKSHIPSILGISRTDDHPLSQTAHEVLKDISAQHPEVFKAHVSELCRLLTDYSPTEERSNDPGALDTLKACNAFANRYPLEMPQDRKFLQSVSSYALHGLPPHTAKYAVSIIIAISGKKEMYAKDLLEACVKDFEYGSKNFLSKLAALSQLVLLAPKETEDRSDAVLDVALKEVLLKFRGESDVAQPPWVDDDHLDDECKAKLWALKILVNRVRSHSDPKSLRQAADPVYQLLNTLLAKGGESSKTHETPVAHKTRFRLTAALLLLKLCTSKPHDDLLLPRDFDRLALTAQDSLPEVRSAFMRKLKKYLGQGRLPPRFYTIVFLQAFEPHTELRDDTVTWIRSRTRFFAQNRSTLMETIFARLLSLLAHHPDFGVTIMDLTDSAHYILFYLRAVATQENLSLIYYVAQQVKQTGDAVVPEDSENLYYLSDLAQTVIRLYEDVQGWSMQAWPGKLGLPQSLFQSLSDHDVAQDIATRSFLPDGLIERLEALVKAKPKMKRKSDHLDRQSKKRVKATASGDDDEEAQPSRARKSSKRKGKPSRAKDADHVTPRKTKSQTAADVPSSEIRRSGRTTTRGKVVTYAESSEDDKDDDAGEDAAEEDAQHDSSHADSGNGSDAGGGDEDDEQQGTEKPQASDEDESMLSSPDESTPPPTLSKDKAKSKTQDKVRQAAEQAIPIPLRSRSSRRTTTARTTTVVATVARATEETEASSRKSTRKAATADRSRGSASPTLSKRILVSSSTSRLQTRVKPAPSLSSSSSTAKATRTRNFTGTTAAAVTTDAVGKRRSARNAPLSKAAKADEAEDAAEEDSADQDDVQDVKDNDDDNGGDSSELSELDDPSDPAQEKEEEEEEDSEGA